MKPARIIVLVVAVAAGGIAALLASAPDKTPPQKEPSAQVDTTEILVARVDINIGQIVSAGEFQWQVWPVVAAAPSFIRKSDRPGAIDEFAGSIARSPFVAGEPIREARFIKAGGAGFMAAILPTGMRAVAVEISPENGAGGFILPNDRVDVILSVRRDKDDRAAGADQFSTETVLFNVRVLAVDQTVEEKNGQRVVVGKTATLELTGRQAETLALSRIMGTLSLALRSLADASLPPPPDDKDAARKGVNIVRFGVSLPAPPK